MRSPSWLPIPLMLLPTLIGTAECAGVVSHGAAPITHRITSLPGDYSGLSWLPNGWLVVEHRPTPTASIFGEQIWRMRPDGRSFQRIDLPLDPLCRQITYLYPQALPDGRLGLVKLCDPYRLRADLEHRYLVAYETNKGTLSRLMATDLDRFSGSETTWSPQMDRGMLGQSSSICAGIGWISPMGIELTDTTVTDGGTTFLLDQELRDAYKSWRPGGTYGRSCSRNGRAENPAWSPDGKRIAFLADASAIGSRGFTRLDHPWKLYLMDPRMRRSVQVMDGLGDPCGPAWSPDSLWVMVCARRGSGAGTWVVNVRTHEKLQLFDQVIAPRAWAPDGRQVATIVPNNPKEDISTQLDHQIVVIVDLPRLLWPPTKHGA